MHYLDSIVKKIIYIDFCTQSKFVLSPTNDPIYLEKEIHQKVSNKLLNVMDKVYPNLKEIRMM